MTARNAAQHGPSWNAHDALLPFFVILLHIHVYAFRAFAENAMPASSIVVASPLLISFWSAAEYPRRPFKLSASSIVLASPLSMSFRPACSAPLRPLSQSKRIISTARTGLGGGHTRMTSVITTADTSNQPTRGWSERVSPAPNTHGRSLPYTSRGFRPRAVIHTSFKLRTEDL